MSSMTISELAKECEVNLQTIRYYEKLALIDEPPRTKSGYRQYSNLYIEEISFIKNAQDLGFSLEVIKKLVDLKKNSKALGLDVKKVIREKIQEIDAKIVELGNLKAELKSLDNSCSGDMPTSCCPIINALASKEEK